MANYMREIAGLLGVELGEAFKIKTPDNKDSYYPYYYRLTENSGIECSEDNVDWEMGIPTALRRLLLGDVRIVKLPWKPKEGEEFYIPCIHYTESSMATKVRWLSDNASNKLYQLGLVCKTRDEAIAMAKKMIAVVREEK